MSAASLTVGAHEFATFATDLWVHGESKLG